MGKLFVVLLFASVSAETAWGMCRPRTQKLIVALESSGQDERSIQEKIENGELARVGCRTYSRANRTEGNPVARNLFGD